MPRPASEQRPWSDDPDDAGVTEATRFLGRVCHVDVTPQNVVVRDQGQVLSAALLSS